jgi:hypothetical protein
MCFIIFVKFEIGKVHWWMSISHKISRKMSRQMIDSWKMCGPFTPLQPIMLRYLLDIKSPP